MAEKSRKYFSYRTNKVDRKLDITQLRKLFFGLYSKLCAEGYLDNLFGRHCIDNNYQVSNGAVGSNAETFFLLHFRKDHLYPINDKWQDYTEDDIFDLIELLHDYVSKRSDSRMRHAWCECGGCDADYDENAGRYDFKYQINEILCDYEDGYELSENGEVVRLVDPGLNPLLKGKLPHYDPENVETRVQSAIRKFRSSRSTLEDRRDSVRELADVLEFIRPKVKDVLLQKDEAVLFRIANEFAIRHHSPEQKSNYDPSIWHGWMFYFYLSTIHVILRLLNRQKE